MQSTLLIYDEGVLLLTAGVARLGSFIDVAMNLRLLVGKPGGGSDEAGSIIVVHVLRKSLGGSRWDIGRDAAKVSFGKVGLVDLLVGRHDGIVRSRT